MRRSQGNLRPIREELPRICHNTQDLGIRMTRIITVTKYEEPVKIVVLIRTTNQLSRDYYCMSWNYNQELRLDS